MIPTLSILIAQSYPNISGVDADFVKNFMIMTAFIGALGLTGYVSYRGGRKQSGSQTEPVHVAQPMHIQPSEGHAVSQALKEIHKQMEAMQDSGREREMRINKEIHAMHQDLRDRIEPIAQKVAAHESTLSWIKEQIAKFWDALDKLRGKQSEDVRRLHERVDGAYRMAASANAPKK